MVSPTEQPEGWLLGPLDIVEDPDADPKTDPEEGETEEEQDGDAAKDDAPSEEEPSADDRLAELERLSADQRSTIEDLRRTVGRAQSIAARLDDDKTNDELRDELRALSQRTADTIAAVVDGLDPTMVDSKLRAAVAATQAEAASAAERAKLIAELREEGIINKPNAEPEVDETREAANELGREMVTLIKGVGLDYKDEAFDWDSLRVTLAAEGPTAVRTAVMKTIREQIAADASDTRREGRRTKTSPAPAAAPPKTGVNELDEGTLEERIARAKAMGIIQ